MTHLPDLVTLLTMLLLFATMMAVGRARGRYGIKAPAVAGHPDFERALRVQMNTLEQTVMFLPLLWLAAQPYANPTWAGLIGLVWLVARIWYAIAYSRAAEKRHWPFVLGTVAWLALLLLAGYGVVHAMLLQPA